MTLNRERKNPDVPFRASPYWVHPDWFWFWPFWILKGLALSIAKDDFG